MVNIFIIISIKAPVMSKDNKRCKYLDAASPQEIDKLSAAYEEIRQAKRKPKKLKIEAIIPTVARCLQMGKSSRQIVSIVSQLHGIDISKDSILRFNKNLSPGILNKN